MSSLFADGTACTCLEQAVEDIDIEKVRRERPKKVGRWRQSGRDYVIHWGGGRKPKTIKGKVAPPRIVPGSRSLQGTYQSIGGGGNTMMGAAILAGSVKDLTFYPDGSFEQSNVTFASSPAGVGWSKRGKSGSWSLNKSTLTLSYLDGKTIRTSLFFAAKPSKPDPLRVLWIGGKDYKRRK